MGGYLSGRALLSHGRGHWFDPSTAHHSEAPAEQGSRKFPGSLLFSEWSLLRHFGTVMGQCQWRDRVKRHPGELSYGDDPTIEKRGQFWRVKIRRAGLMAQTKTFDN